MYLFNAELAQMVERGFYMADAVSSSLTFRTIANVTQWQSHSLPSC